jgi:sn-glycerol 3-phosphate transport system permease protein
MATEAAGAVKVLVDPTDDGAERVVPKAPGRGRVTLVNAIWYVLMSLVSFMVLFPVWMTIVRALSDPIPYLREGLPPYPVHVQWGIFGDAWTEGALGRSFLVALVMTLVITVAQLVTSVLAAYSFTFLRYPGKGLLFALTVATLLLPIEVTLVVNARTIRSLDWVNTMQGLTAPFLATAFGIFLIRQAFLGIPRDLSDAAKLDGYSHWRFMWRVAVPVCRPAVASFALVALLSAWGQYTWPRLAVTESDWEPLQLRLAQVAIQNIDRSNIGFAGALIAAVPVVILLIIFQRQLIRGLTAGAVKG